MVGRARLAVSALSTGRRWRAGPIRRSTEAGARRGRGPCHLEGRGMSASVSTSTRGTLFDALGYLAAKVPARGTSAAPTAAAASATSRRPRPHPIRLVLGPLLPVRPLLRPGPCRR